MENKKNTPCWDEESELEFQMGDMNGIAFEEVPPTEQKVDSGDMPDIKLTDTPFYENIKRKVI